MAVHDIYNTVPSWVMILSLAVIFMVLAAGIYWLLRHVFPTFTEKRGNLQAHAILVGILASTYGIMLGFIIVILWQASEHVRGTVSAEASELALIVADSYALPAPERQKIFNAVAHYIKIVRTDEWEAMRNAVGGSAKRSFTPGLLFKTMISYQPQTDSQRIFYQEIITHLNKVVAYRRERLDASSSALPATLRTIIVISAMLIIIFICVLQSQRKKPDLLKILLVSAVMAANIGLIFVLDYPFSGDISIDSHAFEQGILADFKL